MTDEDDKNLLLQQAKDKVLILDSNFTLVNNVEMLFVGKAANMDHQLYVDTIAYIPPNKDYFVCDAD